MKIKELRSLSKTDLENKISELKKDLIKDRAQAATGTVPKNPSKIRLARRTIARIETILAQKTEEEPKA